MFQLFGNSNYCLLKYLLSTRGDHIREATHSVCCVLFIFFNKTSPYLSTVGRSECNLDKIITKYNLIITIALSKRNLKSIIYVTWTFFIHSHSLYCRLFIIFCIVTPELIVLLKGVVEAKGVGRECPPSPVTLPDIKRI